MSQLVTTNGIEERVRAICMALPEATERLSHGAPAFLATKQFLALMNEGHHDDHFAHRVCAAPLGAQQDLITIAPDRIFRPPHVGARGWIGVRLDQTPDRDEIEMFIEDAYREVAAARQIALLERGPCRADRNGASSPYPRAQRRAPWGAIDRDEARLTLFVEAGTPR